jgi:hypothetical protein
MIGDQVSDLSGSIFGAVLDSVEVVKDSKAIENFLTRNPQAAGIEQA